MFILKLEVYIMDDRNYQLACKRNKCMYSHPNSGISGTSSFLNQVPKGQQVQQQNTYLRAQASPWN